MALKEYEYQGATYQFDDENAPEGAVLVEKKSRTPKNKQAKPANKSK